METIYCTIDVRMIESIKFGKHGVLLQDKTKEVFFPTETIDLYSISRIGCRVELFRRGAFYSLCWHFKNLQDAIDLMEWIACVTGDRNAETI